MILHLSDQKAFRFMIQFPFHFHFQVADAEGCRPLHHAARFSWYFIFRMLLSILTLLMIDMRTKLIRRTISQGGEQVDGAPSPHPQRSRRRRRRWHVEPSALGRLHRLSILNVIIDPIIIFIIIITRPKPAYGRQGPTNVLLRASGAQLGSGKWSFFVTDTQTITSP